MPQQYWLLKTEPSSFSIHDLEKAPKKTTHWEGVRNYQARNFLRDSIKEGDGVLFYHSNTDVAIMGIAIVVKKGYPDSSQFDPKSKYYDASADPENPRWYLVDIRHQKTFKKPLLLQELRKNRALSDMKLLQKGMRLSVQTVTPQEWKTVLALAEK